MARLLRWAGYAFASVAGLLVLSAAAVWVISSRQLSASVEAKPEHLATPTPSQLADADRVARTLGCFGCHGEGLRGNRMFDEPGVGTIWAPNLTRVAMHATDQQLASAIRQGVSDEGRPLIVMPSEVFQHLSDQEVAAIIALLRKLPRSGTDTPPNVYGPIGRLGLAMGRFKTAPQLVAEYSVQEPIPAGAEFEPGRQLAISRCSGCHGADLSGKEARPGEISPDLLIAGAYDPLAFTKLLRAGVSAGGQKLPMMGPTARSDLSHLTDSEIAQLHGYLVARAHKISH